MSWLLLLSAGHPKGVALWADTQDDPVPQNMVVLAKN